MPRSRWLSALPSLTFPLVLAACGGGGGSASRPSSGPAAVHTLAYEVADCREGVEGVFEYAALRIRQGEHDPVTVMDFPPASPLLPSGLCGIYALARGGVGPALVGGVQRLAVSPDGSVVIFEATNATSFVPADPLPPEEEGMFLVRADGSGLRKLGPASRDPAFRLTVDSSSPTGLAANFDSGISFSPDGRLVAFPDLGPGPAGEDAIQAVTLDIATGKRTQVTHLPLAIAPDPLTFATSSPFFIDDETLFFSSFSNPDGMNPEAKQQNFTVKPDGTGLQVVLEQKPFVSPGSQVIPTFNITATPQFVTTFELPGPPVYNEVFLFAGVVEASFADATLLQLTSFRRPDTYSWTLSVDGQRALFTGSADPRGTNPFENCQLFSIDTLGTNLRQLTTFGEGEHSVNGCGSAGRPVFAPGCGVFPLGEDPDTQTLVFFSNCDPLGTNPNGTQIFAMHQDGTGLRQLTDGRGVVTEADGTITVESPGVFAYGPSF